MRVISGKAKGRKLKSVPGDSTRPVLDRVKEAFFNIVRDDVPDARWLDLFAGTGQIGIEALSRGAAEVVFTDNVKAAIKTIHANLKHTQLTEGADVRFGDAFGYLDAVGNGYHEPFDLIYIAPPQYKDLWVDAIMKIDAKPEAFLHEYGRVVVQIDPREYKELPFASLEKVDQRKYGGTILYFYETAIGSEEEVEETADS